MASRRTAKTAQILDATATEAGADIILKTNFSSVEQDIGALLRAASLLVEADTPQKAALALDHNLELWIAIKSVVQNGVTSLSEEVQQNLLRLAQYVASATLAAEDSAIETRTLVSLSRINMNIAEGLLRGQQNRFIQQRAYEIWEQEGRPEGRQEEHWKQAEAELSGMLPRL